MALINCPECGKEISDKSEKCIYCGFPLNNSKESETSGNTVQESKQKNNKIKIYVLVGILVAFIAVVIGILVAKKIDQDKKEKTYAAAVEELDNKQIAAAKELFISIGDYSDAQDYVELLTSKISGVSDDTYYLGIQKLDELYSDTYRENLQKYIAEQGWIDKWESNEVTKGDLEAELSADPYFEDELNKIKDIPQNSEEDSQFEALIEDFYFIVLDNAYGREEGQEFSMFYETSYFTLSIFSATADTVKNDPLELDSIIDEAYTRIKGTTDLEGFDDIKRISTITFYGEGLEAYLNYLSN